MSPNIVRENCKNVIVKKIILF